MKQNRTLEKNSSSNDELLHQLVQEHALSIKKMIYLYVNDAMETEDILQDVFISCYQNLDTFKNSSSYKTWLIRIAINKCKDYHKRWSIRSIFYRPIVGRSDHEESAEQTLLTKETTDEMMLTLSRLTPKLKEVLILYYYEELKMEEIADILEINVNTVKSRLLRAKAKLKKEIEEGQLNG